MLKIEKRLWWYANDGSWGVDEVEGLSYESNPGSWYLPQFGVTVQEGYQLFPTKEQALLELIRLASIATRKMNAFIARLKEELND